MQDWEIKTSACHASFQILFLKDKMHYILQKRDIMAFTVFPLHFIHLSSILCYFLFFFLANGFKIDLRPLKAWLESTL